MNNFGYSKAWLGAASVAVLICLCEVSAEAASNVPAGSSDAIPAFTKKNAPIADKPEILDKYIRFVGPDTSPEIQKLSKYHLKCWTDDEILTVRKELLGLYAKIPGLFETAAPDGPISLLRTSKFWPDGVSNVNVRTTAVTNERTGEIVIADSMFNENYPGHGYPRTQAISRLLTHELTHAADGGARISYSKEWVAFAEPVILDVKDSLKTVPWFESSLTALVVKSHSWPSYYGCSNVKEALAEYFAAYICKPNFAFDPIFAKRFAPRVLNPIKSDREYALHYRRGGQLVRVGKFDLALKEFTLARDLDPLAPMPHSSMSGCYFSLKDTDNALRESGLALSCFEGTGLSVNDPLMLVALRHRAELLRRSAKYGDAKLLYEKLLEHLPQDYEIKSGLKFCNFKLHLGPDPNDKEQEYAELKTELARVFKNRVASAYYQYVYDDGTNGVPTEVILSAVQLGRRGEGIADLNSRQRNFYDVADAVWYGLR